MRSGVMCSVCGVGVRVALRRRVECSMLSGMRVLDVMLPVGRGQRQLILGDRYSGRSSVVLCFMLSGVRSGVLGGVEGYGVCRVCGVYVGISSSISKLSGMSVVLSVCEEWSVVYYSSSSSSVLMSFMLPLMGVSMLERMRDVGLSSFVSFDDLSKHSKCHRCVCLLRNQLPARDAYSADVFNVHSGLLERSSSINSSVPVSSLCGSITALPIIETINNDVSEYIATNVISITDGQCVMSKLLFNLLVRPAIDLSLSVSRVGSNAQCRLMKVISSGMKNELVTLRNRDDLSDIEFDRLTCLNHIFYQDHLFISEIETSLILLLVYRNGILFNNIFEIHKH